MYYNDPALGQAFSNLAKAFGPPSGSDLAGYARAGATRQEAQRLAELYKYAQAADFNQAQFDRMGQATGQWTPSTGYYGVNTAADTARRGQDVTARTTLATNAADNERALATNRADNQRAAATSFFGALKPGEVAPAVPEDIAAIIGLPPIAQRSGLPETLTKDQVEGAILQGMDPQMQEAITFGSTPLEQVIMDDKTQFATRPQAVGQTPAPDAKEGARKDAVAVINGQQVPVTRGPSDLVWKDAAGNPIPEGAQIYEVPKPTGTSDEIGMTNSVTSGVQNKIISTQQTLDTAKQLRAMIEQSPSSQGLVGMLRGTAQDMIQTGNDMGQFFGEGLADVNNAVRQGFADAGLQAEFFDPSIPAIEMVTNLLAWQYAKSLSGERVSNEQLRQARAAIGGNGIFANRANSMARLDELIRSWDNQLNQLQTLQPGFGIDATRPAGAPEGNPVSAAPAPQPPSPPSPPAPAEAGQSNLPQVSDDASYEALPPGAVFLDPDGNKRRKPGGEQSAGSDRSY